MTGKGGVGKTTVAAALGLAAARAGRRTVVCELGGQRRMPTLLGTGAGGPATVTIDAESARDDWLRRELRSGIVATALGRSRAFQLLTAAAPGLAELLAIGKVWDMVDGGSPERARYELAIVDGPSTGQALAMLGAPRTYSEVARAGPVHRQARRIDAFLRDAQRSAVLGVALAEEMPVNETLELEARLGAGGLALERVLLNELLPARYSNEELARMRAAGEAVAAPERAALRVALTGHERTVRQRAEASRLSEGLHAPRHAAAVRVRARARPAGAGPALARARGRAVIERMLDGVEVCVCAGSGGVGKTSTAAAIGLGMAARGRKVAVLTIDPARRLANALGLPELGNEERRVEVDARGELWAMMLDAKQTFDELVELHAPDAATRDAVLGNRVYQELSRALAGSQEYMAMEKLYELHTEGRYDLLVLDTPPTRSALDFLDAPGNLRAFIDSRTFRVLTAPTRLGLRAFGRGSGMALSALERATGIHLLQDLSEFFRSFGSMSAGFRDRADEVDRLLSGRCTTFVLVTAPRTDSIDEALRFRDRLAEAAMPFGGVVANRVHSLDPAASARGLSGPLGEELARKVAEDLVDQRMLAERDARSLAALRGRLGDMPLLQVPELTRDVHDLDGLRELAHHLFGGVA